MSGVARAEQADLTAAQPRTMRGLFLYFLRLGSAGFGGQSHSLATCVGTWSTSVAGIPTTSPSKDSRLRRRYRARWRRSWRCGSAISSAARAPRCLSRWRSSCRRFCSLTAVAALYAHYQGLSQVQSVFFGVGRAVMAIIAITGAAIVIGRQTIHGWISTAIGIVALALLLNRRLEVREPALVGAAALAGLGLH